MVSFQKDRADVKGQSEREETFYLGEISEEAQRPLRRA
jgi:hypothetical protein